MIRSSRAESKSKARWDFRSVHRSREETDELRQRCSFLERWPRKSCRCSFPTRAAQPNEWRCRSFLVRWFGAIENDRLCHTRWTDRRESSQPVRRRNHRRSPWNIVEKPPETDRDRRRSTCPRSSCTDWRKRLVRSDRKRRWSELVCSSVFVRPSSIELFCFESDRLIVVLSVIERRSSSYRKYSICFIEHRFLSSRKWEENGDEKGESNRGLDQTRTRSTRKIKDKQVDNVRWDRSVHRELLLRCREPINERRNSLTPTNVSCPTGWMNVDGSMNAKWAWASFMSSDGRNSTV